MDEEEIVQYEVSINPQAPLFVISVVSEMVSIPIWTLRRLDEMGIVRAQRLGKKTRCYSKIQIGQLNYIHYLMDVKRVNINGIKFILESVERKEGREDVGSA